jgi:hypothetical protein
MEAILKFNLPEETEEHLTALNGGKYKCILSDMDNWLRAKYKYEDQETVTVEESRAKLRELMQEYEVTAD